MIVLSLGGSLINPGSIDIGYLKKFRAFITKNREKFIIVCGGGSVARQYMTAGRKLSNRNPDWIGIDSTLLNARLVAHSFGCGVYSEPIKRNFSKILVAGGWKPGCSTDLDAVLWAEKNNVGTVFNLSNIDYVYDRDPRRYSSAKPIKSLSWNDYLKLCKEWKSGMHSPFDPVAARRAMKSKITVIVLNGKKLNNLRRALDGKSFVGTVLK